MIARMTMGIMKFNDFSLGNGVGLLYFDK